MKAIEWKLDGESTEMAVGESLDGRDIEGDVGQTGPSLEVVKQRGEIVRANEKGVGEDVKDERREVEERERKRGELEAREEMRVWLGRRGAIVEVVEERGGETVERTEGVAMVVAVKSVIATGEAMGETRGEGEEILELPEGAEDATEAGSGGATSEVGSEECDKETPELQLQTRDANEAEEAVAKAMEEWRRSLEARRADAGEAEGAALAKRSVDVNGENGGLVVRGQMGKLRGKSRLVREAAERH